MAVTTEQITQLEALSGEKDRTVLQAYLRLAGEKILNKRYPFDSNRPTDVPKVYWNKQVELANTLLSKRGAEGESVHNENGINRSYISEKDLLADIVPIGGVFG